MLCLRKIPVAKNYMDRKRGFQDFPPKNFCHILPNSFVGEPFSAVFQKFSGGEKLYG